MKNKYKKILKIIVIVGLIIMYVNSPFCSTTWNISKEGQKELMSVLEIKNASSFKFVHIKLIYSHGLERCLELKFKISNEDYEKNGLKYGEAFEEVLLDCNYIEKEKNGIYRCVVRRTNTNNYEFYRKLNDIK